MVDLSNGRGWLNPAEAASIARIDRHIGRPLQISEAGRSFFQQDRFHKAWLNGTGNYALSPYGPPRGNGPSIHQRGGAIDTDDWVTLTAVLNEHGWFQTVFWPDGSLREGWHFEYFADRDQHINDPAPAATQSEEDDMAITIIQKKDSGAAKSLYDVKTGRAVRPISKDENSGFRAAGAPAVIYITMSDGEYAQRGGF